MIKKSMTKFLIVFMAVWLVGGCAKKLMPPEVEGQDASTSAGGTPSGIGEGGVGGSGGGTDSSGGILQEGKVGESGLGGSSPSTSGKSGSDTEGFGGSGSGAGSGSTAGQEARSLEFVPTTDLGDVHFAFDKYDLDENSKKVLQKNADWLKQHPGVKSQIEGHCDERGTNNYNLALGERRALAVKKYLAALGVEDTRLYTISYGEEKPFCMEHNESCWKQNRRGHFLVSK